MERSHNPLDPSADLVTWIDSELAIEESDHARNAGSAWSATVFATAGILAIGYQARPLSDPIVQFVVSAIELVLGAAACMFVGMQFDTRWECADNAGILRAWRDRLCGQSGAGDPPRDGGDGIRLSNIKQELLEADESRARRRRRALLLTALVLLIPPLWRKTARRARSEFPCYVAIIAAVVLGIGAIWWGPVDAEQDPESMSGRKTGWVSPTWTGDLTSRCS